MSIFGDLAPLREKPIPAQERARAGRKNARSHAIDRANPLFREPLADLSSLGIAGENYYFSERNPPYWRRIEGAIPELLARHAIGRKLAAVNARLAEAGLELFVFDAWRPRAVQVYFHDVWMPAMVKARQPLLSDAAVQAEVERYWAAPTRGEDSPAPHETGAAIDLTIRMRDGAFLWMGSLFDDVTEIAHRDHFERAGRGLMAFSDDEARANRRLLHWVMDEQGFAGHPDEWWHFSHGDQLWAAFTGAACAFYGLARAEPVRKNDRDGSAA